MERAMLPEGLLVEQIDAQPAAVHPLAAFLKEAGMVSGASGFHGPSRRNVTDADHRA